MPSERLHPVSRRGAWHHLTPPLVGRRFATSGAARPPATRIRRGPAALDLHTPPLAVWPGEVVALAGPRLHEVVAMVRASQAHRDERVVTVLAPPEQDAWEPVASLAACIGPTRGLVVFVALVPDAPGRRTLAGLRRAVATRAPCRCLWLVDGRVYPE